MKSDAEVIQMLRSGDEQAFTALYERYKLDVFHYCYHRDKLEGDVVLMVTITERGKVSDVSVKSGVRRDLEDAADESKKARNEKAETQSGSTPKLVKSVNPEYPKEAARQKIEGTVHVEMVVDGHGNVSQTRIIKEVHPLLDEAALVAARQWKFDASRQQKRSVVAPIRFRLSSN